MNLVGELMIARSRLDRRLAQLDQVSQLLLVSRTRLGPGRARLRVPATRSRDALARAPDGAPERDEIGDLRDLSELFAELEFDRYDDVNILARSVAEMSADVGEAQSQHAALLRSVREDTAQIQRLTAALRKEITRARMVPIGRLFTRVAQQVREAARATGKAVTLTLRGETAEVDNSVIEQVADPLLHLIQNAIGHGIEPAAERERLGKPAQGRLTLSASQAGGFVLVEVEDDGRGIDATSPAPASGGAGPAPARGGHRALRPGRPQPDLRHRVQHRGGGHPDIRARRGARRGANQCQPAQRRDSRRDRAGPPDPIRAEAAPHGGHRRRLDGSVRPGDPRVPAHRGERDAAGRPLRDHGLGRPGVGPAGRSGHRFGPARPGAWPQGRPTGHAAAGRRTAGRREPLRSDRRRAARERGDRHQEPGRAPRGCRPVLRRHDLRRGASDPAPGSDPAARGGREGPLADVGGPVPRRGAGGRQWRRNAAYPARGRLGQHPQVRGTDAGEGRVRRPHRGGRTRTRSSSSPSRRSTRSSPISRCRG